MPLVIAVLIAVSLMLVPRPGDEIECVPTDSDVQGPFYREGAPERTDLVVEDDEQIIFLAGEVVGWDCRPIPGAWLDFWQADVEGDYDNTSIQYFYRGQQFADADGRWTLSTNVPAPYPGRPKHLHVKLQGEFSGILTTQLYFPDDPENADDPFYDKSREIQILEVLPNGDLIGTYQFQLAEPGSPTCPADFTGDGAVDGEDLTFILSNWGSDSPVYDLDEDGTVGGSDLTVVLASWGICSES